MDVRDIECRSDFHNMIHRWQRASLNVITKATWSFLQHLVAMEVGAYYHIPPKSFKPALAQSFTAHYAYHEPVGGCGSLCRRRFNGSNKYFTDFWRKQTSQSQTPCWARSMGIGRNHCASTTASRWVPVSNFGSSELGPSLEFWKPRIPQPFHTFSFYMFHWHFYGVKKRHSVKFLQNENPTQNHPQNPREPL